jgi:hypothetical protein
MWPDGKAFAFTVFDDPDAQTVDEGKRIYGFLGSLGLRTTRGVWPGPTVREPNSPGETCEDLKYLHHTIELQSNGFEIGYHNTTKHSSTRAETIRGLDRFRAFFGRDPRAMANHYNTEAIYWGRARVTPPVSTLYTIATLGRTSGVHFGHVEDHPAFWGDLCRARVEYCRNFVYAGINTLAACPWMPYHDPLRPWVKHWYASSEGSNVERFTATLSEAQQDRLEAEGGACIMYTHFGHGFVQDGRIQPRFKQLMERLSGKNGWFVPVSTLLDYLRSRRPDPTITDPQRRALESRWLWEKLFRGTS